MSQNYYQCKWPDKLTKKKRKKKTRNYKRSVCIVDRQKPVSRPLPAMLVHGPILHHLQWAQKYPGEHVPTLIFMKSVISHFFYMDCLCVFLSVKKWYILKFIFIFLSYKFIIACLFVWYCLFYMGLFNFYSVFQWAITSKYAKLNWIIYRMRINTCVLSQIVALKLKITRISLCILFIFYFIFFKKNVTARTSIFPCVRYYNIHNKLKKN